MKRYVKSNSVSESTDDFDNWFDENFNTDEDTEYTGEELLELLQVVIDHEQKSSL